MPRVESDKLTEERAGESSEAIQTRVEHARKRQQKRFAGTDLAANADMRPGDVRQRLRANWTRRGWTCCAPR